MTSADRQQQLAHRTPVIVGVGQINDRSADPGQGMDPIALMEAALGIADADGCGGWLSRLDSLAVVKQISFPELDDVAPQLARRIGARPRLCADTPAPTGDAPIRLLNEAAIKIGTGEIKVAAIVGGEALRTAGYRLGATQTSNSGQSDSPAKSPASYRAQYGLNAPVDLYPLYENASRPTFGQTLSEGQRESSQIWSLFSQVAAGNSNAWLRQPMSPEEIETISAKNRPMPFPYTKFMVANSSVNQGAGFIVTSLAEARERGIPESRIIYVGYGAAAREPDDVLLRDAYDRSASMSASLLRTLEFNRLTTDEIDHVELYSCFPCVPKMARRIIGWPVERPASVFGGLTFGGGPIANYMSHAVASMVDRLRDDGRYGLLFANGGYATYNHSIVLGRQPITPGPYEQDFNVQADADAQRGPIPELVENYNGPATIESYTVFFMRDGSVRSGVIVARTTDGKRTLASVPAEDHETISLLVSGTREPIGAQGIISTAGELQVWHSE